MRHEVLHLTDLNTVIEESTAAQAPVGGTVDGPTIRTLFFNLPYFNSLQSPERIQLSTIYIESQIQEHLHIIHIIIITDH